ncbi:MAG: hemolysin family protein [bacterium]|nr:hemolysin family protein [bacterium]
MNELSFYYFFGKVTLVATFLLFSALFSSFETAFFSLDETNKEITSDLLVVKMLNRPKEVLIDILIGNTLVNILASIFATSLLIDICRYTRIGIGVGITAAIVLMTLIIIFLGEIIPKTFAIKNSEILVRLTKPLVNVFSILITPIRFILLFIANLFVGKDDLKEKITEKEVKTMFDIGRREGIIKEEERKMLYKIFEFSRVSVKNVMVPKDKIVSVSIENTLEDVLSIIKKTGFSRIPIYKDSNNIIGIVYAKDLIEYFGRNRSIGLESFIREVYFIPEFKKINSLFYNFQEHKIQMAMVIDKIGSITGLVTMEDLIEEVIGEIRDEFDKT